MNTANSFVARLSADALLRKYAHFDEPPPPPPPPPSDPPPPPEDKKFSQSDLDRIAGETRKSAKQAAISDLMKELGFEKPDDLKVLVKAAKERDDAEKTEAQKAVEAKAQAEKERDEAKAALATRNAEIDAEKRAATRDNALKAAANAEHAFVAEDVIAWAEKNAPDMLAKSLKDDGTADATAITALVKKCREARPTWFGKGGVGTGSHSGGRLPEPGREGKELALTDLRERQRKGW